MTIFQGNRASPKKSKMNTSLHKKNAQSVYWRSNRWMCAVLGCFYPTHYGDVIMDAIASQITSLTIVYSTVYSEADQRKHKSSASMGFVRGIHRGPVNSPHKWPVTRKMLPFDDVIVGDISWRSENALSQAIPHSITTWRGITCRIAVTIEGVENAYLPRKWTFSISALGWYWRRCGSGRF